jgi:hypothetical protein
MLGLHPGCGALLISLTPRCRLNSRRVSRLWIGRWHVCRDRDPSAYRWPMRGRRARSNACTLVSVRSAPLDIDGWR